MPRPSPSYQGGTGRKHQRQRRSLRVRRVILTDIRKRLGEPEPEAKPLDLEMKTTLDELDKKWTAQPDKQRDRGRGR